MLQRTPTQHKKKKNIYAISRLGTPSAGFSFSKCKKRFMELCSTPLSSHHLKISSVAILPPITVCFTFCPMSLRCSTQSPCGYFMLHMCCTFSAPPSLLTVRHWYYFSFFLAILVHAKILNVLQFLRSWNLYHPVPRSEKITWRQSLITHLTKMHIRKPCFSY
jgi:hypothetical protein